MIRGYVTPDLVEARRLYERALAAARTSGDFDLELCSLSGLGEKLVMAGEAAAGLDLIDEAMAGTLGGECARLDTVVFTVDELRIDLVFRGVIPVEDELATIGPTLELTLEDIG